MEEDSLFGQSSSADDVFPANVHIRLSVRIRRIFHTLENNMNRSPKGNMWSAIPVALLCMIVNWSKGWLGRGPEGDEVL